MSQPSTNPLRQVMDAVGAEVEWKNYDGWGVHFPEGYFKFNVGPSDDPDGFESVLKKFGGPGGTLTEWKKLQEITKPLILAATTFPPMCLRADLGALKTLEKYLPTFLSFGPTAASISGPFLNVMKKADIQEGTFLFRWLDYLSFALSGLLADGTVCAAVSYTLGDLHVSFFLVPFAKWFHLHTLYVYAGTHTHRFKKRSLIQKCKVCSLCIRNHPYGYMHLNSVIICVPYMRKLKLTRRLAVVCPL